jgi:hypothetical protein
VRRLFFHKYVKIASTRPGKHKKYVLLPPYLSFSGMQCVLVPLIVEHPGNRSAERERSILLFAGLIYVLKWINCSWRSEEIFFCERLVSKLHLFSNLLRPLIYCPCPLKALYYNVEIIHLGFFKCTGDLEILEYQVHQQNLNFSLLAIKIIFTGVQKK